MKIGEVAQQTGLAVSNIRFYEKKGLLTPDRREESRYREFTSEDVERLKKIVVLRKAGISIEAIGLLLEEKVSLQETLVKQKTELQEQMKQLEGAVSLCNVLQTEASIKDLNADKYLNYMEEEEEKGNRFAEVTELMEDLTFYTGEVFPQFNPLVAVFCKWKYYPVARVLAALLYWVGVPLAFTYAYLVGRRTWQFLLCFIIVMGIWLTSFVPFLAERRKRHPLE